MYRITARQILVIALGSALFASVAVLGFQKLSQRFYPAQAELSVANPETVSDPATVSDEQNNIEVYKAVSPGVVYIQSTTMVRNFFDLYAEEREGAGSGSVIDEQGHILTNFHVIEGATRLSVHFGGGRNYPATVVGRDPDTDLAVIKLVEKPKEAITIVPFGDSDKLIVGQKVLAIGNPFGLDRTLTTGVISGLQRPLRGRNDRPIEGAIQTDASINPGNSGGPLLDSRGRMIGINSQIQSTSGSSAGVGFAIPVNIAKRIVPELIRSGTVQRPKLGILPRNVESLSSQVEMPVNYGVLILNVQPGGPAANAGLRGMVQTDEGNLELGDIITGVGGERVGNNDDLYKVLNKHQIGETVNVEIYRGARRMTISVRLTDAPPTRRNIRD
ncbi:MAG: trypsin-like peptidase domain-containing protein [Pyrinomonadaceae bacterium]